MLNQERPLRIAVGVNNVLTMIPRAREAGQRPPSGGLRARILLLVLLTALPAFGLVTYESNVNRQRLLQKARDDVLRDAQAFAVLSERRVDETSAMLAALSRLPSIRALDPGRCSEELSQVLTYDQRYSNLMNLAK